MVPLSETLGLTALRLILKTGGISQTDLGRELGWAWVHDVRKGRARPSPNFIRDVPIALANRLSADPDEMRRIFFPEEANEPTPSVLDQRLAQVGSA